MLTGRRPWAAGAGKLAFAAAYTLTVLPFTVQFFSGFVRPPAGPWLTLYLCALPLFLGSLEYVSVSLACLFWRDRKGELLALFAACQLLAVTSTVYDVRAAEWSQMVTARRQALQGLAEERKAREESVRTKRAALDARLRDAEAESSGIRGQIGMVALAATPSDPFADDPGGKLEARKIGQREAAQKSLDRALGQSQERIAEIRKQIVALEADAEGKEPSEDELPGTSAPTALAYASETATSGGSLAALFLALFFPLTVIAFARYLVSGERPSGPLASVDLRRELDAGAALPDERHDSYASLLEPVLAAHVAAMRATRAAAARGLSVQLDLDADLDVLESVASLKEQVEGCALSDSARGRLLAYVDQIIAEGVSPACRAA